MEIQAPINLQKGGLSSFLKERRKEAHSYNEKLTKLESELTTSSRIHNGTILYNIRPSETIVFLKKKLRLLKNQSVSNNPKSGLFLRNIQIIHIEEYDRALNFYITRIGLIFTFNRNVKCIGINNIKAMEFSDKKMEIAENSAIDSPFRLKFKDKDKYEEVKKALKRAHKSIKKIE